MSWKDRQQEHEAVMMLFITIAIIGFLYALAILDSAATCGESVNTDTGNIRYHAKRIQEGL